MDEDMWKERTTKQKEGEEERDLEREKTNERRQKGDVS